MMTMTARISGCPAECMNGPSIIRIYMLCGGQSPLLRYSGWLPNRTRYTKICVVWGEMACGLVDVYRNFGGSCCLHLQGRISKEYSNSRRVTTSNFTESLRD
jgi:hypothetical protein